MGTDGRDDTKAGRPDDDVNNNRSNENAAAAAPPAEGKEQHEEARAQKAREGKVHVRNCPGT